MKMFAKYVVLLLLIYLPSQKTIAQTSGEKKIVRLKPKSVSNYFRGADVVFDSVKTTPKYPGGQQAFENFLRKNINISVPFQRKCPPGTYTVIVRFQINQKGRIVNIGADSGVGYGLEEEVIRSLSTNAETWQAARNAHEETVSFATRQMVIFVVEKQNVSIKFSK